MDRSGGVGTSQTKDTDLSEGKDERGKVPRRGCGCAEEVTFIDKVIWSVTGKDFSQSTIYQIRKKSTDKTETVLVG